MNMEPYSRPEGHYQVYEKIHHKQQKRILLHNDLQAHQRNHRLNRAAWLQGQWLEISEQERRAHIHNQKLLQDFQRAQDTLSDMVACTEAMNTIRLQYEKYLEVNFQQWQQRLKDIRVSEKSKMEEKEGIKTAHSSNFKDHPVSTQSPDPSQTSPWTVNPHQRMKDIKHTGEGFQPNHKSLYIPPTWLTASPSFVSGLSQNSIPKDYKNMPSTQDLNSITESSLHKSHPQFLEGVPHITPAGASWTAPPMLNQMKDVTNLTEEGTKPSVEKQNVRKNQYDFKRHGENGTHNDRSSELDSRPVRLSVEPEGSSEGSPTSSEIIVSRIHEQRRKKRNGTKSQLSEDRSGSSGESHKASETYSDTEITKTRRKMKTSKKSIIRKENETMGHGTPQSSISSVEKDESEDLNSREDNDSDGDDIIVAVEKRRKVGVKLEKADLEDVDERTDEEKQTQLNKELSREKTRIETEGGRDVQKDTGDGRVSTEEDEGEVNVQDQNEAEDTREGIEDDKRKKDDSLEELYGHENEEKEEDYDVDGNAHSWSRDPFENPKPSSEDENDDIEDLLNPHCTQIQKKDDVEVTEQSNDEGTGLEEKPHPQQRLPSPSDEPVGSDDEFDHFYD